MNTYAYDASLPCKNPNCKSHGKPHPNCQCYSHLAEGGEAAFCSQDRKHTQGCEYFMDGGEATDDLGFKPDPAPAQDLGFVPEKSASNKSVSSDLGFVPENKEADLGFEPQQQTISGQIGAGIQGTLAGVVGKGPAQTVQNALAKLPGGTQLNQNEAEANYPEAYGAGQTIGMIGSPITEIKWLKAAGPAVANAVQMGAVSFGDELQDYMAGKKHLSNLNDDEVAAMHIAGSAGTAFFGTKMLGALASKIGSTENVLGKTVADFSAGIGAAHDGVVLDNIGNKAFKNGYEFFNKITKSAEKTITKLGAGTIAGLTGAGAGYEIGKGIGSLIGDDQTAERMGTAGGNIGGALAGKLAYDKINPLVKNLVVPGLQKMAVPLFLRAVQYGQREGFNEAVQYASDAARGQSLLEKHVTNLFNAGAHQAVDHEISSSSIDKMKKWIEGGGADKDLENMQQQDQIMGSQQSFAHGGEVTFKPPTPPPTTQSDETSLKDHRLGTLMPGQNVLLNESRARVSNYLKTMKPQEKMSLPFDNKVKDKDSEKKYDRAIELAINPLAIVKNIKKGTVVPEDLMHLNSMHPGMSDLLKKKMSEEIIKKQLKGEKPSYHLRQGLSLFLGAPLDSTFTPSAIMAAQATFARNAQGQPSQQQQSKPAKNTSKMDDISKQYRTPEDAAELRSLKD